jgi:UDP:flavonoid glycosyltransferase YjiC (YdhE family)
MSGKRIVFCTFGSLGDVYPYLAIARELRRAGESPVIATTPSYRKLIEQEGIDFHPVRPDIDISDPALLSKAMDRQKGGRFIVCDLILPALRDSYEDTARIATGADLLVTHPMSLAASLFARKSEMPWASTALAPVSMYSTYDAPVLAGIPAATWLSRRGPVFQKYLLKAMASLFEPLWKPFREFERKLGLERAPNPLFWGHSPQLALALFSPRLASPQRDWPQNSKVTGFPYFEHGGELPPELEKFLNFGEPPLVFTLGSAAVGVAGDFFEESVEAVRMLRRRAVLLIGRDPRNKPKRKLPASVIAIEYAPHAAVFPRACAVVHQGGIGTTAEAMRAGRPMLVVSYSHDQPDHAARLVRLGVARAVDRKKYNSNVAAREIRSLLECPRVARRAEELAGLVRKEHGSLNACQLLRKMLDQPESDLSKKSEPAFVAVDSGWGNPNGSRFARFEMPSESTMHSTEAGL